MIFIIQNDSWFPEFCIRNLEPSEFLKMIETDILIIGAGPTGLFTVFEAGLLKLKCHIIDALPQPGGQLAELYPKKPIFDIPGYPSVLAGDLVTNLMEQIKQFQPGFTLNEKAETIQKQEDGTFIVTTDKGTAHHCKAVAIAGGLGSFEPRKPLIEDIEFYEDKGVEYFVKRPGAVQRQKDSNCRRGRFCPGLEYFPGQCCFRSYAYP